MCIRDRRFYQAILQSQPSHPDANHNLGILAVSMNKADMALPLFKTALEANLQIEQFVQLLMEHLINWERTEDYSRMVPAGGLEPPRP